MLLRDRNPYYFPQYHSSRIQRLPRHLIYGDHIGYDIVTLLLLSFHYHMEIQIQYFLVIFDEEVDEMYI